MESDTTCAVFVMLECEEFLEESSGVANDGVFIVGETSNCEMTWLTIVWGQNFLLDDEVLAVTAGLFGATRPSTMEGVSAHWRAGMLGALFALGTIDAKPSIEVIVRPVINEIYLIFMSLPVVLALLCFLLVLTLRHKALPIPTTAYDFMVLGRENEVTPRRSKRDRFSAVPKDLDIKFRSPEQAEADGGELVIAKHPDTGAMTSVMENNAILEVPDISSSDLAVKERPEIKTDGVMEGTLEENDKDEEMGSNPIGQL